MNDWTFIHWSAYEAVMDALREQNDQARQGNGPTPVASPDLFPDKESDPVNHPAHYGGKDNPYEAVKVIEAWYYDTDFYLGNVLKYLCRAGKKGDLLGDLKKARWYLERRIKTLE